MTLKQKVSKVTHPESLSLWWGAFTTSATSAAVPGLVSDPHPHLGVEDVSGAVSHLSLGETLATAQPFVSSEKRKERWEQGKANYMGPEPFANIKRKLDTYLQQKLCPFSMGTASSQALFPRTYYPELGCYSC